MTLGNCDERLFIKNEQDCTMVLSDEALEALEFPQIDMRKIEDKKRRQQS